MHAWPNWAQAACSPSVKPTWTSTAVALPWREQALGHAKTLLKTTAAPSATITALRPHAASAYSHDKPFAAELLLNQRISGREFKGVGFLKYGGVGKDVRHLELSLQGSGLHYEPGDALGVRHRNPDLLVDDVLQALRLDGDVAGAGEGRIACHCANGWPRAGS